MKALILAATCVALAACTSAARKKYEASVECAANEHARHAFIDQSYDPDQMFEEDGRAWRGLYASVWTNARVLNIAPDRVHRDIAKRVSAFRARKMAPDTYVGELVQDTFTKSSACVKRFGDGRGG